MTIELDKKELETLIQLVYLGNYVVNARKDKTIKKYEEVEQKVFAKAVEAGLKNFEYVKELDGHYPDGEWEELTQEFIDEYEEETTWDKLGMWLAQRDLAQEYGKDKLKKMKQEELVEKIMEKEEVYQQEFEKEGVRRLVILGE
jgi:hypothetical protein